MDRDKFNTKSLIEGKANPFHEIKYSCQTEKCPMPFYCLEIGALHKVNVKCWILAKCWIIEKMWKNEP